MTKTGCSACHQPKGRLYGQKDGFDIYRCRGCGSIYMLRGEEGAEIDYDTYYTSAKAVVPPFVLQRLIEIVKTFEEYRQNNRFLDVGCGEGHLIKAALSENWQVEGTEIAGQAVKMLKEQDFEVFSGTLSEAKFPDNSFDVVTIVEVLEHIPDPLPTLRETYRILRPGGLMWATTPHGKGASARLLGTDWTCVSPPEHLHLFSVKAIRTLLADCGFGKVKISTHGVNPSEIYHYLRKHKETLTESNQKENAPPDFNRVEAAYALNSALSGGAKGRAVKNLLNSVLNVTRLGDSMKIWATK